MNNKKEKSNPKKWNDGDTFAIKITNCQDKSYNGKYLILNHIKRDYHLDLKYPFFRIKIVDNIENISKEKLDNMEYVITAVVNIINSSAILDDILEKNKKLADSYGYLYQYQIIILTNRKYKIPDDLIYLGNYQLKEPKKEYIPWTPHNIPLELWSDFIDNCVSYYKYYNLRESQLFDKAEADRWHDELKTAKQLCIDTIKKIREK